MPRLHLTAENVNRLALVGSGQVLYRDTKLVGFGLRVGTTAAAYFVEKRVDGRNVRHTIGMRGQITADRARRDAQVALGEMTGGKDLNADQRERVQARRAARSAKTAAANYTVKALCDWYVTHQKALGKQSATDAASIFCSRSRS